MVDLSPDTTVEMLRESINAETGISPALQSIYYNGFPMADDAKTIQHFKVSDGDMLYVHVRHAGPSRSQQNTTIPTPPQSTVQPQQKMRQPPRASSGGLNRAVGGPDPELIRLDFLANPSRRQQLSHLNPQLADAVDDPQLFATRFGEAIMMEQREREARQREIERLNADPFDVDAQARIAEMIRQERVMENLQNAMEHTPEGEITPPVGCMKQTKNCVDYLIWLTLRLTLTLTPFLSIWSGPLALH
jgi:DNA damage-inducible protein 1